MGFCATPSIILTRYLSQRSQVPDQSRRRAISRPRMFSGTPYSSITFLIAVRSSGASTIPTNRAGVPRMWYTAQEWLRRWLIGGLGIAPVL
jgi:hypothetical protein